MKARGEEVEEWRENKRKISRESEVMRSSRIDGRLNIVSVKGKVGEVMEKKVKEVRGSGQGRRGGWV